uniref:hypothetical protein n=1 Tax=Salmonella enterica TaxID=28901 RepID=UPI00398C79B3
WRPVSKFATTRGNPESLEAVIVFYPKGRGQFSPFPGRSGGYKNHYPELLRVNRCNFKAPLPCTEIDRFSLLNFQNLDG